MSNLQTWKFIFCAQIGELVLKANVSSPTNVTWKRSQQSVVSQTIDLVNGKANFNNEQLKLPVNMYFDPQSKCFQEKKSSFSFTMKTPKGQKTAGIVYIDLSRLLNNKLEELNEEFALQKCPVKDSFAKIRITYQCLGEKNPDSMSIPSIVGLTKSEEKIGEQRSGIWESKSQIKSQVQSEISEGSEVKQLKQKVESLTKQNESLKKQLAKMKEVMKGEHLKEEFLKSKALQDRLEEEVNVLKKQNLDHEKQLEEVRVKLEEAYTNLYSNLSKHFF